MVNKMEYYQCSTQEYSIYTPKPYEFNYVVHTTSVTDNPRTFQGWYSAPDNRFNWSYNKPEFPNSSYTNHSIKVPHHTPVAQVAEPISAALFLAGLLVVILVIRARSLTKEQ